MNREINLPYLQKSYDTKERFISYWHQIEEILNTKPGPVLEIGVGNKFVENYLRERCINLTTLDIEAHLLPDVSGSVSSIPFKSEVFDTVSCCEVLEHLPYSNFLPCLLEIIRVSRRFVILSLPDVTTSYRIHLDLPRLKTIHKLFEHPYPRPDEHVFDGEHYWEIGKKGYPLKRITESIKQLGLTIISTYRVYEFPYHRFFILEKPDV